MSDTAPDRTTGHYKVLALAKRLPIRSSIAGRAHGRCGRDGSFLFQLEQVESRLADLPLSHRAKGVNMLNLRPVVDAELQEVVQLLNRAYRGKGLEAGWTTEDGILEGERISLETLQQEMTEKPSATLLVWKPKSRIEGCIWLEIGKDNGWYLGSVAINPDRQNEGYGRLLLQSAEALIRTKGGKSIEITVLDVRSSLIEWYERRGYGRTGKFEPWPENDFRFGVPQINGLRFAVLSKVLW